MKILVTAGATWIKVDDVRILTSRFTGKTGAFLAEGLCKLGHQVTLVVNPHALGPLKERAGLEVVRYHYFEELKEKLKSLCASRPFDAVIHTAAVSDYRIVTPRRGKIASGKSSLTLTLVPAEKLITLIRSRLPDAVLIQFKLEIEGRGLITRAYRSLAANRSDFVVANALNDLEKGFRAFLVGKDKKVVPLRSQREMVTALDKALLAAMR